MEGDRRLPRLNTSLAAIGPVRWDVRGLARGGVGYPRPMIILGVILILLGALIGIPVLYTIGIILAIVGVVLWVLGAAGHAVGGRTHYY